VRIALEGRGALERLERLLVVATRLIGVADRVIGVEARRIPRERREAHREPLVVVAGLLQEEPEHRQVLRLVGARLEASPRDADAAAIIALGDAVQPDDAHGDPVVRMLRGDLAQDVIGTLVITALHGIDRAHVQALALVLRVGGHRGGLTSRGDRQVGTAHAPGDVGLRAVGQHEPRIGLRGRVQGFHRPAAPAEEQVEAALVRGQGVGRRGGHAESGDVSGLHAVLREISRSRSAATDPSPTLPWNRRRA
jgi:hypothetical protein